MKTRAFFPVATLCSAAIALHFAACAEPANERADSTAASATASGTAKPALSTGLSEIAKLSKAGIDDSVILVYIRSSSTAYTPTPEDLIQLREQGVSSTVTAAMMQRGDELRKAAADAWKQPQTAPVAQPAPVQQQPVVVAGPTYYTPPVSTVTVIGYPRTYGYSYPVDYYRYNSCYPSYSYYPRYYGSCYSSYPRFSVGVNFGGGYHGHHGGFAHYGGSFHGGSHGGHGRH